MHIPHGQSIALKDLQEAGPSNPQEREQPKKGTKRTLDFDDISSEESLAEESLGVGSGSENAAECDTALKVTDYVLVRFDAKKQMPRHYVRIVCKVLEDEIEVDFYRKTECENGKLMAFEAPTNKDECPVDMKDVKNTLKLKQTNRATLFFDRDKFSGLLVR